MRSKSEELMLRIREYIESYFERYSSTPTVREIAGAMKIAVSSAHRYLVAMAEKDMVFYENGTLSTPKIRRMNPAVSPAAIVGSIPCGSPEEKEAQVEEYLPLSVSFFGKGDFYALRASGSSMEDAQIDDGDLVIIRQQHTAQIGEIVVALTDEDKNTLKRLLYDDDRQSYYLHPENKDMEDIYVSRASGTGRSHPCDQSPLTEVLPMQKKYVSVSAEVEYGRRDPPALIRWHDGRQWEVTKVLHTCTASHDEFEGVRYTVKIGRAVRYLYREGQRWYVDRSP